MLVPLSIELCVCVFVLCSVSTYKIIIPGEITCGKYTHINLVCNQIKIPLTPKFNYKIGCHQFVVFTFSNYFPIFAVRSLCCLLARWLWHWHTIDTIYKTSTLKNEMYINSQLMFCCIAERKSRKKNAHNPTKNDQMWKRLAEERNNYTHFGYGIVIFFCVVCNHKSPL